MRKFIQRGDITENAYHKNGSNPVGEISLAGQIALNGAAEIRIGILRSRYDQEQTYECKCQAHYANMPAISSAVPMSLVMLLPPGAAGDALPDGALKPNCCGVTVGAAWFGVPIRKPI